MTSREKSGKSQGDISRRAFVGLAAAGGIVAGFLIGWIVKPPVVEEVIRTVTQTTTEMEVGTPGATVTFTKLPSPNLTGTMSTEEAIFKRRSIREYADKPLTLNQLSQLLWAAQGITDPRWGFRAAPSAGATYPLEVYAVVGKDGVSELEAGVYRYNPNDHTLGLLFTGDLRGGLSAVALGQQWVAEAPLNIIITAVYERTTARYGERGTHYVHMEAGHVGQNIYLQATALGLGTVVVGAFEDAGVQKIIMLPEAHKPLYIIPVGYPK